MSAHSKHSYREKKATACKANLRFDNIGTLCNLISTLASSSPASHRMHVGNTERASTSVYITDSDHPFISPLTCHLMWPGNRHKWQDVHAFIQPTAHLAIPLSNKKVGGMWIAVHITIQEDHVIKSFRYKACNLPRLDACLLQGMAVCDLNACSIWP